MKAKSDIFGKHLRVLRDYEGIKLEAFADASKTNAGNISRIERGLMSPPVKESTLLRMAETLDIKKNSPEWVKFYDYARISSGRLPMGAIKNKALMARLPFVLRVLSAMGIKRVDGIFNKLKK